MTEFCHCLAWKQEQDGKYITNTHGQKKEAQKEHGMR